MSTQISPLAHVDSKAQLGESVSVGPFCYVGPEVVVGDVNNDGIINLLDVGPFVDAISSGEFVDEADTNRDGVVNLLDITLMITLLSG